MRESTHLLKDLSNNGHSYWKFSQSTPGTSVEYPIYSEYKEGEYTTAQDPDKRLSFVSDTTIAKCFMYGDQLTKFSFDTNNPKFLEISNQPYKYLGGGLGEHEAPILLVEKNYSLKEKSTIRLLASMIPDYELIWSIGWLHPNSCLFSFEARLSEYGFTESVALIRLIRQKFSQNLNTTKNDILPVIDNYKEF